MLSVLQLTRVAGSLRKGDLSKKGLLIATSLAVVRAAPYSDPGAIVHNRLAGD